MTDITPETLGLRKVRVALSQPPVGSPEWWRTHQPIRDEDPVLDECCEDLDLWIAKRNRQS